MSAADVLIGITVARPGRRNEGGAHHRTPLPMLATPTAAERTG
jgi:hypothetical protein